MKRIIFDTSAYGEMIIHPEIVKLLRRIVESNIIVVYGIKLIRKELRDTPRNERIKEGKLRLLMLDLYDSLVSKSKRELKITDLIEIVAKEYFLEYKKSGGGFSHDAIINDLRIIACASLHSLDIVVSHDKKSMMADKSIQAYRKINTKFQLRS